MKTIFIALLLVSFAFMPDNHKKSAGKNQDELITFGLIADVQYSASDPAGTRYYRNSLTKLADALGSLKEDSAGFIINLGDLIDKGFSSFEPALAIIEKSGLRTYHITGNHDYSVDPGMKGRLPVSRNTKGYFSFTEKNFRFIFLNGNEISIFSTNNEKKIKEAENYIDMLKNKGYKNAIEWNGGIGSDQLVWLDKELTKAEKSSEKVFIFCHYPIWPENHHNLLNYKDILSILETHRNIIAVFSGHNHAGNYGNFKNIHFVTLKGMVETEKENSFALVEVYKNNLRIKGYGRQKDLVLAY